MKLVSPSPHKVIYLYSRHPLVVQIVTEIISSDSATSYSVEALAKFEVQPDDQLGSRLLLLDACSIPRWPEYFRKWQAQGGRSILLISADSAVKQEALHALHLGISGVISISGGFSRDLINTIRAVNGGKLWASPEILAEYVRSNSMVRQNSSGSGFLTLREEQVLGLLGKGFSNKEIAAILTISQRTVKFHVSNILQKYHAENRIQLLSTAILQSPDSDTGPLSGEIAV